MVLSKNNTRTERDADCRDRSRTAQENFAERFMKGDDLHIDKGLPPSSETGEVIVHVTLQGYENLFAVTVQNGDGQRKDILCSSLSNTEKGQLLKYLIERLAIGHTRCRPSRCCAHRGYHRGSLQELGSMVIDSEGTNQSETSSNKSPVDIRKRSGKDTDESHEFPLVKRRRRDLDSSWRIAKSPRSFRSQSPEIIPVRNTKILIIGDFRSVLEFYTQRFRDIQQFLCKLIAKAWVKIIHPNKQTNHPYAGRSQKAPPWWPPTPAEGVTGTLKNGFVRHVEPDHLLRDERLILLPVILGHVTDPPSIKIATMSSINVAKLEQVTNEAIGDKLNAHASKRMFLNELFRVAKQQERFKNGEIDASTAVTVMDCDNRFSLKAPGSSPKEASLELEDHGDGDQDLKPGTFGLNTSSGVISDESSTTQTRPHSKSGESGSPSIVTTCQRQTRIRPYQQNGISDPLSYAHSCDSQNQVATNTTYTHREASNYTNTTSMPQEPTRRHPLPSHGFTNSSQYFPNYNSSTNMIPVAHYQQFQPTTQLPITPSFVTGPQLPLPPTFAMPGQAIDFGQNHLFGGSGLYTRTSEHVHPYTKELLSGHNGYVHQIPPLQQHLYQDFSQNTGGGDADIKGAHVKTTVGMRGDYTFDRDFPNPKPQQSHLAGTFNLQDGLVP